MSFLMIILNNPTQACHHDVRGGVEAVEAVELVAGCPLALTPQALGPMISFFPVQV